MTSKVSDAGTVNSAPVIGRPNFIHFSIRLEMGYLQVLFIGKRLVWTIWHVLRGEIY